VGGLASLGDQELNTKMGHGFIAFSANRGCTCNAMQRKAIADGEMKVPAGLSAGTAKNLRTTWAAVSE
jgi:hypothetical protein